MSIEVLKWSMPGGPRNVDYEPSKRQYSSAAMPLAFSGNNSSIKYLTLQCHQLCLCFCWDPLNALWLIPNVYFNLHKFQNNYPYAHTHTHTKIRFAIILLKKVKLSITHFSENM